MKNIKSWFITVLVPDARIRRDVR